MTVTLVMRSFKHLNYDGFLYKLISSEIFSIFYIKIRPRFPLLGLLVGLNKISSRYTTNVHPFNMQKLDNLKYS